MGGQSLIIDGRLVRGSHGLAGELGFLVRMLTRMDGAYNVGGKRSLADELRERAWTSEGMRSLVAAEIMCSIVTTSPEVVYVAVDLLPDMDELAQVLAAYLPEGAVPKLVYVCDCHERVLVGEYALCLNALRQAEAAKE